MNATEKELVDEQLTELVAQITPEYLAWLDGLSATVFQVAG